MQAIPFRVGARASQERIRSGGKVYVLRLGVGVPEAGLERCPDIVCVVERVNGRNPGRHLRVEIFVLVVAQ